MQTFIRYGRAFFVALGMTLRGETPPPPKHPRLLEWIEETRIHLKAVYAAAAQHQLDKTAREDFTLRIEGRDTSMEVILAAVRHNLHEEYPRLLRLNDSHTLTVIYASNMNDQFRIARLAESDLAPPVREALQHLRAGLENIPPSNAV